jgi:hypothetical protein
MTLLAPFAFLALNVNLKRALTCKAVIESRGSRGNELMERYCTGAEVWLPRQLYPSLAAECLREIGLA